MSFFQYLEKRAANDPAVAKTVGSTTQPQTTVSLPVSTNMSARQRLLAQPTQTDKWYSGDSPTSSEIMARIYTIGKINPEEGKQLYTTYQTMQADPSSPIYNPYTRSTNKAINELAALGADVSRGIDDDWLASYDYLKNHYRMETGNTPLAPSSKSSTEENAAYWYYRVLQAEPTTKAAEQEWEALQEEIAYWTGRTDRNYSDDEVLAKIDWSNYPTLVGMDEDADKGLPTVLNRPIGYSQDALRGVVWAARNGGDKADPYNSVRAALGQGSTWQENADISAMLDPTNERYNPYAVGSTLDDAALYFGVASFDQKWLDDNRGVLSGNDETAKRYYQKVYDAEQTTQKAEAELAELQEKIDKKIANGNTADNILKDILDKYPTLQAMQTSLESGDLKATTRAIGFSMADITADVNQRVAERDAEKTAAQEKMQSLADFLMGALPGSNSTPDSGKAASPDGAAAIVLPANSDNTLAVENGKSAAESMAAPTIMGQGTPEEQLVFKTAYSADFMTYCTELNTAIETGAPNLAGEYDRCLQMANDYTSQHYFGILEGMRPYEAIQEEIAKIEQEIDAKERLLYNIPDVAPGTGGAPWKMQQVDGVWYQFGAELDPATREWKLTGVWNEDSPDGEVSDAAKAAAQTWISGLPLEPLSEEEAYATEQELSVLKQKLQVARNELQAAEPAYSKAAEQKEAMTQAYDTLARLRELTGVEVGNATGYRALMEDIYTVGAEYKPTEWSLMSRYEYARSSQRYSDEQLATIARENADTAQAEIARLQKMLDTAEEFGIDVPDKYVKNINREIARLGREIKDAEYFLLKTSPEFKTYTEEQLKNTAELMALAQDSGYTDPRVVEWLKEEQEKRREFRAWKPPQTSLLSEDDHLFYRYLLEERSPDEAAAFLDYMTDEEYGRAHLQQAAATKAGWESLTKEMPVTANLVNILISPFRLRGVGYSVESWLSGKEINPGNEAFGLSVIDSAVTETSKKMIDEAFVDSPAERWLLNLGYDVTKAVGESIYNMKLFGFLGSGLSSASAAAQTRIGSASLKILSALATASPMGFQAASLAIQDAKYRGASDDQALLVGASVFLAETMTEAITVANIRAARSLKTAGDTKKFAKVLVSDMLEEGVGEGLSEYITSMSDDAIMKELSNRELRIQQYMADGMTYDEAADKASEELLYSICYAGLVGMLSGGATTGVTAAATKLNPDAPNAGPPNVGLPKAEVADMETDQATEAEDGMPLMQESFGPEEQKKEADQKAKSELSKSVTALTTAATADTASQSAAITAVLSADNASHGVEAVAAAAAQHMVNDMGGARAATKLSNILLTAAENGISPETVKVAVSTAALTNGPAHEALVENRRVTPEYVNNLISLANQETAQPETVKKLRRSINDNQVAMKVAKAASNGAFAEVAPFEDAVSQAKTNRRTARAALEREQKTAQMMGQSLQSLNAEFIEDPTNQMVRGAVQQAIKDVEGQAKVVQEYEQGLANAEDGVQKAERDLETKRRTLLTNLRQQAQADVEAAQQAEQEATQESEPPAEPVTMEETTQESTEEPTQLKSWQDPQYHGKAKAPRKLKTDTKNFEKWFNDPSGDLTLPNGNPRVIYRGTASKLYMEHKAPSKHKSGAYLNFYTPNIPMAATYASGSTHVFTPHDIVNWETAAAAMKKEGFELREEQNALGEWGYRAYGVTPDVQGAKGDFYLENELSRFNKEYGKVRRNGLYAGYMSLKNPLVIDAGGEAYTDVHATVKDKDGNDYTATKTNREWAEWAREQGYDSVIVRNVKDYLFQNGAGAVPGTVIMAYDSQKFKSFYNTGKLGKKNADIRYSKAGTFALTGEAVSDQMKAVLDTLATGKSVSVEDVMNTPEVTWAEEHQTPGESLPWRKEGYTEEDIAEILPEERILLHAEIEDTLLEQGSAVIDESGKTEYTGPVKQEKRVDIVIGPPGAGKSSALANPLSQAYSSRIIDSDAVKELLPEYEGGLNSGYLNTESRYIWKEIVATAVANGDNIVLPVVGRSLSSVMKDMSAFRKNGYSVNVHYLELDGNKVLGRALNRFLTEGRYITPEYLIPASDGGITDVYEALKGEDIDGYSHWNNDVPRGQKPQLLEASDPDLLADLDGRTADQRGTVDAGNRKGPPSESGTGGQGGQAAAAPVIQYAKASSAAPTTQNTTDVINRKLASAQQIAKNLTKKLGVGDYIGTSKMNRVPQGVRGYYETRAKYIAVPGKQAGNYATTMHELGHALAHKIGMTGTDAMVNALDPVFAASYTDAELPGEAFAEFFARYSVDEASARNFAGDDFVDAFQRKLKQTGLNKDVQKSVDQLRALNSASVNEKIGSVIRSRSDKQKTPFREQFNRLMAGMVDSTAAAERVNHEIRKQSGSKEISLNADIRSMALFNNSANKRAFKILCENLTDSRGDIIGDSLSKVLADAGLTAKNEKLFERYMLAKHSLARDAQGKPVFDEHLTKSAREAFIKQVEQEHPEIKKAEEAFQNWRKAFMQAWMVDTGYLSQAAFDAMNSMYEHYVPTRRVKDPRFVDQNRSGGRKYQIRQATGSTEDIWSPMDTFADMVSSIVSMVSQNNVALAWDTAYRTYSLGEYGRAITPDSHQVSVDTTELRDAIEEKLSGDVEEDLLQEVLDLIGDKQTQWVTEVGSKEPNTLVVQRPDGTHGVYTIADPELFKLLAGVNEARINGNTILVALAKITRGMTALTTGSNPIFAVRNSTRDFQNSVNYGSWASNYLTAVPKWVKSFYEVWRNSGDYQAYAALGGGGWTRVETGSKKGVGEIRSHLYKGYAKSSLGRAAGYVKQKAWNTLTLARLNEIIEQTSRFVEYKYGKHDLTTQEGRTKAFLAAQDVTVDFARAGNSQVAGMLKAVVPFFNASLQGTYRAGRMLTEAERGRAPARFAKTVVNKALASALAVGLLLKFLSDEEKEEFAMMSDDLKAKHLYIPNFFPGIFGRAPLIRIPLDQDPLGYAVHGFVTNALWSGQTDDDFVIELGAIANTILDSMNPFGSGSILAPFIDVAKNTTWYGSPIVPPRMESWDASTQYNETTPELFRFLGRMTGMSPLAIQYLAEQYTGFVGQIALPALSVDENTGELGGLNAAIAAVQKRLTSDPLVSNAVVSSFYDGADALTEVTKAVENNRPLNTLRRGLTPEEATEAYDLAKEMLSADGIIGSTKKQISELYNEIDAINANQALSDDAKYAATREKRRKILELAVDANEAVGAFKEHYVTGDNLVSHMLTEGTAIQAPTAYDRMEQTFKDDEQQPYMQRAAEVYKATGEDSALPHPNTSFSVTDKTTKEKMVYEIEPEDWDTWVADYKAAYMEYIAKNGRAWESLTDTQKLYILREAHSRGHENAKKKYAKIHGIKLND